MTTEETLQAADEAVSPVEGSESAPEETQSVEGEEAQDVKTDDTQPGVQEEPEEKPGWQKAIDKQTYHRRQAERELAEAREELEKLKASQPNDVAPEIPPIPDQFDDGYEQKLAERDKALKARTEWETRQALKAAVQQREQQRQAQEAQKAWQDAEAKYVSRAKDAHIDPAELQSAGNFVGSYLNPHVTGFILEQENGPLITTHLAKNPDQLDVVANLPPMSAAAYIASVVAPNVSAKPKPTQAPKPPETLDGGGTPPDDGPPGATYE